MLSVMSAGTQRAPMRSIATLYWALTRPANAGCVPSTPLSSTAILTPLPVPVWNAWRRRSMSTSWRSAGIAVDEDWACDISDIPILDQRTDQRLHDPSLRLRQHPQVGHEIRVQRLHVIGVGAGRPGQSGQHPDGMGDVARENLGAVQFRDGEWRRRVAVSRRPVNQRQHAK